MSELIIVFAPLVVVLAGLALMGVVVWTAQREGFRGDHDLAPLRATPFARRRVPASARRPGGRVPAVRRPAYSDRR